MYRLELVPFVDLGVDLTRREALVDEVSQDLKQGEVVSLAFPGKQELLVARSPSGIIDVDVGAFQGQGQFKTGQPEMDGVEGATE